MDGIRLQADVFPSGAFIQQIEVQGSKGQDAKLCCSILNTAIPGTFRKLESDRHCRHLLRGPHLSTWGIYKMADQPGEVLLKI